MTYTEMQMIAVSLYRIKPVLKTQYDSHSEFVYKVSHTQWIKSVDQLADNLKVLEPRTFNESWFKNIAWNGVE